jgi:hypothetical protein
LDKSASPIVVSAQELIRESNKNKSKGKKKKVAASDRRACGEASAAAVGGQVFTLPLPLAAER